MQQVLQIIWSSTRFPTFIFTMLNVDQVSTSSLSSLSNVNLIYVSSLSSVNLIYFMSIKCQLDIYQVYQVSTWYISSLSSVNFKFIWSIKCQLQKKCCTSDPKMVDQVSTPKKVLHKWSQSCWSFVNLWILSSVNIRILSSVTFPFWTGRHRSTKFCMRP